MTAHSPAPTPTKRRAIGTLAFWGLLLLGFVGVGIRGMIHNFELPNTPRETVSSQYASTDSWLARLLGIPKASQRVLDSLEKVPSNGPILFVCPNNSNATMTYYLLSSLAWPRPFDQPQFEESGQIPTVSGSAPAAIMLYGGVGNGAKPLGGEQIGRLTLIRMKAP